MSRKGESVTLSLTQDEKTRLEGISLQFGCTWGDRPNVSALLKAIANGSLRVSWNDDLPKPEIKRKLAQEAINKIKQGLNDLSQSF